MNILDNIKDKGNKIRNTVKDKINQIFSEKETKKTITWADFKLNTQVKSKSSHKLIRAKKYKTKKPKIRKIKKPGRLQERLFVVRDAFYSFFLFMKYKGKNFFFLFKIIFSIVITIIANKTGKNGYYLVFGLITLLILFSISNKILEKNKILGNIFNDIALFIYNAQYLVLLFSGSFISTIMLSNIDSIEEIGGRAGTYILGIILVIVFTFLPIEHLSYKPKNRRYRTTYTDVKYYVLNNILSAKTAIVLLIVTVLMTSLVKDGQNLVAFNSLITTVKGLQSESKEKEEIEKVAKEGDKSYSEKFYSKVLKGATDNKPDNLPKEPNIVLIFSEGISCDIIESDLDVCPNINKLKEESTLVVDNYFNHTYATYRAVEGTLFSGFQMGNYDVNNLVSIQEILQKKGYDTTFINVEKGNNSWKSYIKNLRFENIEDVPIDETVEKEWGGIESNAPDKYSFEYLYEHLEKKHKQNKPFFTTMYTVGTHTTFNSFDQEFDDGENRFWNKFYDFDYQLGEFMEKFNESEMSEDTVFIFTTDHATHIEQEYIEAFPEADITTQQVRIPLYFYFKNGGEQQEIDANGRTSIDLIPTIFDYLEFDKKWVTLTNYFMGTTLFAVDVNKDIEHLCQFHDKYYITDDNKSRVCSKSEEEMYKDILMDYYKAMAAGKL